MLSTLHGPMKDQDFRKSMPRNKDGNRFAALYKVPTDLGNGISRRNLIRFMHRPDANIAFAEKVSASNLGGLDLPENVETVFKVAPPIKKVPGAHGYEGVMLRDKERDLIQCHVCGLWMKLVGGRHLRQHRLNARTYRLKFGLPLGFPLCSRGFSSKRSEIATQPRHLQRVKKLGKKLADAGRRWRKTHRHPSYKAMALRNIKGTCPDQLMKRYLIIADKIGRVPGYRELLNHDGGLADSICRYYGTLNKFKVRFKLCSKSEVHQRIKKYTDARLISLIRDFAEKNGRPPTAHENFGASRTAIRSHFGSWRRGLMLAGFEQNQDN